MRPRLRISSDGVRGAGTRVEVLTQHGVVVDISNIVVSAGWSLNASERRAEITLVMTPDADLEVLGDLTEVTVEHAPS